MAGWNPTQLWIPRASVLWRRLVPRMLTGQRYSSPSPSAATPVHITSLRYVWIVQCSTSALAGVMVDLLYLLGRSGFAGYDADEIWIKMT